MFKWIGLQAETPQGVNLFHWRIERPLKVCHIYHSLKEHYSSLSVMTNEERKCNRFFADFQPYHFQT